MPTKKVAKRVRPAPAIRKRTAPLFSFNLTGEGRQALALDHKAPDQKVREHIRGQADAIVTRIAGDWTNSKTKPVTNGDDLLTLAIIAYHQTDSHGWARRALIESVLAGGGIVVNKSRGHRLAVRKRLR
jgi:hypothetical protein